MATAEPKPLKEQIIILTRIALAEFIGTACLLLFGCMGCMSSLAGAPISLQQIAWVFGIIVMGVVETFGHISGGHVNPIVTIAAVILGHVPYLRFPIYLVAQCFGAIIGFALLKAFTPSRYFLKRDPPNGPAVCSAIPNSNVSIFQAMAVEAAISFMLILVCCAIWDHRNASNMDSFPIKLGLIITGLAMAAAPWSGAGLNPARTIAPALINNDWDGQWIYWVGPFMGAALAAVLYRFIFAVPKPEDA